MKRNVFLRAAACLLVANVAGMSLLAGTGAKYIASGTVTASARVARFSFTVGSNQRNGTTSFESTPSNPLSLPHGKATWTQIATTVGPVTFTLPLFDVEYLGRGTTAGTSTVISRTIDGARDLVVAPGINGYVDNGSAYSGSGSTANIGWNANLPRYNTNVLAANDCRKMFVFKNDSEVAVKYTLTYDPASVVVNPASTVVGVFNVMSWLYKSSSDISLRLHHRGYMMTPATPAGAQSADVVANDGAKVLRQSGTLAPGDYEILLLDYCWEFDQQSNGGWDVPDSVLGMRAAQYLRGDAGAPSLADITVKPVFTLSVEQVD